MSVTDTCHQADLIFENIGRQCTCSSLASMVYHGIKSVTSCTSNDADAILNYGDSLYSRIFRNSSNEFSLVTSFPQVCDILELRVQVLPGESYTGLVNSNANTPLDYNFETAISNIHQYGILTLGPGMPSFSMSITKHLDTYFAETVLAYFVQTVKCAYDLLISTRSAALCSLCIFMFVVSSV